MIRLDKLLAHQGWGTRKEVKRLIRQGRVSVNGIPVTDDDRKVEESRDRVCVDDTEVMYQQYVYLMMNKPVGYVCANDDEQQVTVFDLLNQFEGRDLFTVGRLDKDTEGLLILTNDGTYAHQLVSPKHHVEKEYVVALKDPFDEAMIPTVEQGIWISETEQCAPASISVVEPKLIHLTLREGKFHQVKRMMHACGNEVVGLRRIRIGALWLDDALAVGDYRKMSLQEQALAQEQKEMGKNIDKQA